MKQSTHNTKGREVPTYKELFSLANNLEVEAGVLDYGQDELDGHKCLTYIRIEDAGGSDMVVKPTNRGVEIMAGGNSELDNIINGLYFIASVLEAGRNGDAVKPVGDYKHRRMVATCAEVFDEAVNTIVQKALAEVSSINEF